MSRHTWGNGPSGAYLVASTGLRAVQRFVGADEQVLGGVDTSAWKGGKADAHRQMDRLFHAHVECLRLDPLTYALGEHRRTVGLRLQKNADEFLAAVARDDVDFAHRLLEQCAKLSQHAVAGEMPRRVVD